MHDIQSINSISYMFTREVVKSPEKAFIYKGNIYSVKQNFEGDISISRQDKVGFVAAIKDFFARAFSSENFASISRARQLEHAFVTIRSSGRGTEDAITRREHYYDEMYKRYL